MPAAAGFEPGQHNRGRGTSAEAAAVVYLAAQGYEIVAQNVRTDAGEIDVVARDGETLCFIEVKARAGERYGPAIEAVDARKQYRLARAAALYLVWNPVDAPCRFDVLGLDYGPDGWAYTLVRDAFQL